MQFGLDVPTTEAYADPGVLAQLAVAAESAGWDGFFIWDVLTGVDPWVALTTITLQTSRIKLGLMVLPLARHRPWLVAQRLADLDRLSQGRVICTVGLGHQATEFAALGEPADPLVRAQKLDEGLAILDGLWSHTPFSFTGSHYILTDARLATQPVQVPRIPLWVAGGWPRHAPFRRAARWDGICFKSVHHETRRWLTLEEFQAGLAYVQAHRPSDTPFDVIMSGDTSGERQAAQAKVQAFQDAGATWWIEEGMGWSVEEFMEHIRNGPPRT